MISKNILKKYLTISSLIPMFKDQNYCSCNIFQFHFILTSGRWQSVKRAS